MYINIAVCDDEEKICSQVESILTKLLDKESIQYNIDIFVSGEDLCRGMENVEYDLIFLDIQLPQMDGVEIGRYIREVKRNDVVQIAYISSQQEYAMELFDSRPINFLIKPLDDMKIKKVLEAYIKINGGRNDIFHYRIGRSFHKIEIYKIRYFIRTTRKVTMYTLDGCEEFYGSLEKIYEKMKYYGFLFIHKSYMVNSRYIKRMRYDSLVMSDDREFSISQSRRKEIRNMYKEMEEE